MQRIWYKGGFICNAILQKKSKTPYNKIATDEYINIFRVLLYDTILGMNNTPNNIVGNTVSPNIKIVLKIILKPALKLPCKNAVKNMKNINHIRYLKGVYLYKSAIIFKTFL